MEDNGDEFNAAVAAELRAQRGRVKKTVDALVQETGLSKSAVLNYLNDKRDIPVPAFYALCMALGISPASVVTLAESTVDSLPATRRDDYDLVANDSIDESYDVPDTDFDNA